MTIKKQYCMGCETDDMGVSWISYVAGNILRRYPDFISEDTDANGVSRGTWGWSLLGKTATGFPTFGECVIDAWKTLIEEKK